jgi:hypothetical protein
MIWYLAVVRGFGGMQEVIHVGALIVPKEGGVMHPPGALPRFCDALRIAPKLVLPKHIVCTM